MIIAFDYKLAQGSPRRVRVGDFDSCLVRLGEVRFCVAIIASTYCQKAQTFFQGSLKLTSAFFPQCKV